MFLGFCFCVASLHRHFISSNLRRWVPLDKCHTAWNMWLKEKFSVRDIQYPIGCKNNSEANRNSHNTSWSMPRLKIKLPKRASMHILLILSALKRFPENQAWRDFIPAAIAHYIPPSSPSTHHHSRCRVITCMETNEGLCFGRQVVFQTYTMDLPTSNTKNVANIPNKPEDVISFLK